MRKRETVDSFSSVYHDDESTKLYSHKSKTSML